MFCAAAVRFGSFDAAGWSVQSAATWSRREAEHAHGGGGGAGRQAGISDHGCQDADSVKHNEATFFLSLSQSRRDRDDKAESSSLINAALQWCSDTSVPSHQEWRNITHLHA